MDEPTRVQNADERFRAIAQRWDKARGAYRLARRLEHPDGLLPAAVIEGLVADAFEGAEADDETAFVAWVRAHAVDLAITTLNGAALRALRHGAWDDAMALASEVNARENADLLAQRLFDAARAQRSTLEGETERWLRDRFCAMPFEQIETRNNGDVHLCCPAWLPVPVGQMREPDAAFWNSARALEIRRSILDGDFSHCSRWHCPRIAERRLPRRQEVPERLREVVVERRVVRAEPPSRVILSHDRSCNISCPSCRTKTIMLSRAASTALDDLVDNAFVELIGSAGQIKVTGSGDPFASRHFRRLLRRLSRTPGPPRRLQIHSNGLLLDERTWRALELDEQVGSVWISTDAARADTYAVVRRGGDFAKLRRNLDFLAQQRRAGAFDFFRLDFVVQQRNYAEMAEMVELAEAVAADLVYFSRIRNWGTFEASAFMGHDVCHESHPEHERLLEHLRDPRLGSPKLRFGSVAPLVERART